ncbi:MAG: hypothetical protein JW827_06200 [Spirochaetes bacterium]|nr:hypothetical protein [Spirochaetota bacterium]
MKFTITHNKKHLARSGVYMGSIGAGGFEVRPDGMFYRCRLFNHWKQEIPLDAFFLHRDRKKNRILRLTDLVTAGRIIEGVKKIEFQAEFPRVKLHFPQVHTMIEFTSLFIPHDLKHSTLPSLVLKVKGKGRMIFFLPSFYPSIPSFKNNRIVLKSKEGQIALGSKKGKAFYVPQDLKHFYVPDNERLKDIFDKQEEYRLNFWKGKKDHYYAAVFWEGDFEDEVIISWFYPDMRDNDNNFMGHFYTRFFKNASQVLDYTIKNKNNILEKVCLVHKRIYSAGLPEHVKDSYSAQLSSFVKQSWLARDGKFGVWEGSCCCCGLQTTDVSFYGSWLYAKLFPRLEKTALELTAKFQRADGWIGHFFPGSFKKIDEYRRKDMNMQFILMAFRDYNLWDDISFLKKMYPAIKKALLCTYQWDTDGDLIPDIEGPDQTFDAWGWNGCSIYLGCLQLAALKVSAESARLVKDKKFQQKCEQDLAVVRDNLIKKLWNGKYFDLWTTDKKRDNGCLLDALSGDWYCYLMGLGHILPEDMILSHLRSCLKHNRKKMDLSYMQAYSTPGEKGWCYINGGYPDNKRISFQQYEPWTGTEYSFALHLAIMGLKKKAFRVIKDVHNRKKRCGMFFNHIECGGDYFRPMVIGALWDRIKQDNSR